MLERPYPAGDGLLAGGEGFHPAHAGAPAAELILEEAVEQAWRDAADRLKSGGRQAP